MRSAVNLVDIEKGDNKAHGHRQIRSFLEEVIRYRTTGLGLAATQHTGECSKFLLVGKKVSSCFILRISVTPATNKGSYKRTSSFAP